VQALRIHSVEETVTARWSLCNWVELSFHRKAPPPVERVESIMTSLAGLCEGKVFAVQLNDSTTLADHKKEDIIRKDNDFRPIVCFIRQNASNMTK